MNPLPREIALGSWLRRVLVTTALVVLCGAAPPAMAATRLVAPAGSDSGNCTAAPCASLGYAYKQAGSGDVVTVAPGVYGEQHVPDGSKSVTFNGGPGVILRQMSSDASNVTYDGINVNANGQKTTGSAFGLSGDNSTVRNARIGNVVDEKGMLASGENLTIDNVVFHDAVLKTNGVHMECVYAIVVPGFTIRNSTFRDCAIMDLFFTYGNWWNPLPPAYGNVTIENNVFGHSEDDNNSSWHYYGLYIASIGPNGTADPMSGWVVRNNTFENEAAISPDRGSNGTRWVNNLGNWECKSGIAFSHNVGKKCSGTDKQVSPASSTSTVMAALGWLNPGLQDFHLKPGSPAINAGDPNDAPALDREGLVRDAQPDAGAHEFGAVPSQGLPATPIGGKRLFKRARLRPHVICKRKRRHCPKVAKLRLAVRRPARMTLRVKRIGRGAKRTKTRTNRFNVAAGRTLRIRARSLPRGLYRVSVVAASAAGAKSKPRSFRLRVR
jgi:hypothetical protein